ncbi:hypothetical protein FAIPA1_70140 [Frankia sp. AiPs1]
MTNDTFTDLTEPTPFQSLLIAHVGAGNTASNILDTVTGIHLKRDVRAERHGTRISGETALSTSTPHRPVVATSRLRSTVGVPSSGNSTARSSGPQSAVTTGRHRYIWQTRP